MTVATVGAGIRATSRDALTVDIGNVPIAASYSYLIRKSVNESRTWPAEILETIKK